MYTRGVKIFSSVSCWFKPYLTASWEPEPVSFSTILDDRNPSARYVTVPLNRRTARSIRCRFYYADTWMMFSEISFQSGKNYQTQDVWRPSRLRVWFSAFVQRLKCKEMIYLCLLEDIILPTQQPMMGTSAPGGHGYSAFTTPPKTDNTGETTHLPSDTFRFFSDRNLHVSSCFPPQQPLHQAAACQTKGTRPS